MPSYAYASTAPSTSGHAPPTYPPTYTAPPPSGNPVYSVAESSQVEPPPSPDTAAPAGDAGVAVDERWVLPSYAAPAVVWDRAVEIGINGTAGNAETASLRAGFDLERETDLTRNWINGTYLKAEADGTETQHNALMYSGIEQSFTDSLFSAYAKSSLEYDEFKDFDIRLAYSAGFGFKLLDLDTTTLTTRFGGGGSYEIGGSREVLVPEAALGADFEAKLTERQKLTLIVDYYPEWNDFNNYRVVADAAWEVLLDAEHNLSLKMSANDRYDSTPQGREPNDINYALLLLWRM